MNLLPLTLTPTAPELALPEAPPLDVEPLLLLELLELGEPAMLGLTELDEPAPEPVPENDPVVATVLVNPGNETWHCPDESQINLSHVPGAPQSTCTVPEV